MIGALCIVLAAVCWGVMPVFSRYACDNGSDALSAAVMRASVAAVVYAAYGAARHAYRTLNWKEVAYFAAMGLFTTVGMYLFYMLALDMTSTAVAVMLLYTAPAFVILLNRLCYKERITRTKLILLCVTLVGCALVVRLYDVSQLSANALGVALGLASGFCYAMVTVFGRRALRLHSAETVSVMPVLLGALVFQCIRPVWTISIPNAGVGVSFALLGLVGSAAPLLLYNKGMQLGVEGGNASLIATIEPVVATACGMLFFQDAVAPIQFVGMALVLAGAMLPVLQQKREGMLLTMETGARSHKE